MYNEGHLRYPVLCISTGNGPVLHYARAVAELVVCTSQGLKSGFYSGLRIVDSIGRRYAVLDATKTNNVGPWWGFNLLGGQRIRVALTLEMLPAEPLADLKTALLRFIDTIEMYDADPEIRRMISAADDFSGLISALAAGFYKEY
jgi:myo-inositol-hexaphosphate 3-phosphohydrolase